MLYKNIWNGFNISVSHKERNVLFLNALIVCQNKLAHKVFGHLLFHHTYLYLRFTISLDFERELWFGRRYKCDLWLGDWKLSRKNKPNNWILVNVIKSECLKQVFFFFEKRTKSLIISFQFQTILYSPVTRQSILFESVHGLWKRNLK